MVGNVEELVQSSSDSSSDEDCDAIEDARSCVGTSAAGSAKVTPKKLAPARKEKAEDDEDEAKWFDFEKKSSAAAKTEKAAMSRLLASLTAVDTDCQETLDSAVALTSQQCDGLERDVRVVKHRR